MADPATAANNQTKSKTVTDTIIGEHTHTIVGYSLIKGIGDGEPIASERFTVGGHEWVLLFYPDGKRSSATEGHLGPDGEAAPMGVQPLPGPQGGPGVIAAIMAPPAPGPANEHIDVAHIPAPLVNPPPVVGHGHHPAVPAVAQAARQQRRDTTNEYAALFVALIGEGPNPQGIVNTTEGKVVRAFHRFTLVDQAGQGRDLTKGRTRDAGAVKISCARQDPNARNCHGYRKFVKRSILEDPNRGFLMNDTIVIKYTIELVVSSGGALSRGPVKPDLIKVPPPSLSSDLAMLFHDNKSADLIIETEDEEIKVHTLVLEARSKVLHAHATNMREGKEGRIRLTHMRTPVVKCLLYFVYSDQLPEEHEGSNLSVAMAQHLLVAADQYQLPRLRRICEQRLCETVDVETVGTTLMLAEMNRAEELKKVCLDFVSRNLGPVLATEGWRHLLETCERKLMDDVLKTLAQAGVQDRHLHAQHRQHNVRPREHTDTADEGRRVRPRH